METRKLTPLKLFSLPQHFVIPIFQRPYVWEEESQWAPLWQDISRVAERNLREPHAPQVSHFIGAVVLQASAPEPGSLSEWSVIDGQQRLTTLQLLMDAANASFALNGLDQLAIQLAWLTHNNEAFILEGSSALKVRHLNKDRSAFDEVMNADPSADHSVLINQASRIARAHSFFKQAVTTWLGDPASEQFLPRANQLSEVLQNGIQLVSIDLTLDEDSQEIFETLNARGTPLTASDLVRNYVFQKLETEGADSKDAYEKDWPFESKFWETEVSSGRQFITRSSLFMNQWLVARLGEEVSPHTTFSHFKSLVEHGGTPMSEILPNLKRHADWYQACTEASAKADGNLSPVEMAFYRMKSSGVELLKPMLIWLADPSRDISPTDIYRVVQITESWMYRRQLLRLSNSDLGRVVADVIRTNKNTPGTELADRISAHLSHLNVASTYWPGDAEIIESVQRDATYRRYPRPRLRMFIEAIEDHLRLETRQPQVQRGRLPIEHVLPQRWEETWPVETAEAGVVRDAHVHRLGNLTLLTTKLNSKVSNAPWPKKSAALLDHNTIILTGRLISSMQGESWNERAIDTRSEALLQILLSLWPVPKGHEGKIVDPTHKSTVNVEVRHLLDRGLVTVGDRLVPYYRDSSGAEAEVLEGGSLRLNGQIYLSLSAAARAVKGSMANGWTFWKLADGQRLKDLRTEYLSRQAQA